MKLLKELLADSHSGDYTNIIKVITSFLKKNTEAKIITQKISKAKANVIAIFGSPSLVINCHMDTAPPTGGWKFNPLQLTLTRDKIYGLGAADTKGNIYCLLKAVAKVKPKNLMLLFSVDEEAGRTCSGVAYFLQSKHNKGIKHAIVCEPTSLKFVNQHKGYYSYIITARAAAGHSSIWRKSLSTTNAITKTAGLIIKLDKEGFNIGRISGGIKGNILADNCEFKASIRTYQSPSSIMKKLKSIVKRMSGVKVQQYFIGLPLLPAKALFPFTGSKMQDAEFWTEASLFSLAGIDAVVLGAGNIKQAHSDDESVNKKELEKAQKMFEDIIGEPR